MPEDLEGAAGTEATEGVQTYLKEIFGRFFCDSKEFAPQYGLTS